MRMSVCYTLVMEGSVSIKSVVMNAVVKMESWGKTVKRSMGVPVTVFLVANMEIVI